jgi:hypothetical protein
VIKESLFNGPSNKSPQPIGLFRLQLLPNRFPGLSDAAGRYINPNASIPSRVQQFKCGRNSIVSGSSNGNKPVSFDEYVSHLVYCSSAPE